MPFKKLTPVFKEARRQFENDIVTAGLNEGEQHEIQLIEKIAHLISGFMEEAEHKGVGMLGAFRVCFSTVEALAQQIDEVIDEHNAKCDCGGVTKDPNNNGGLLH